MRLHNVAESRAGIIINTNEMGTIRGRGEGRGETGRRIFNQTTGAWHGDNANFRLD